MKLNFLTPNVLLPTKGLVKCGLYSLFTLAVAIFPGRNLQAQSSSESENQVPLIYTGDSGGWTNVLAASNGPYGRSISAHKASSSSEYLEYSLGGKHLITRARLAEDNDGNWHVDEWKVQYLENGAWRDAFGLVPANNAGWNEFVFPPVVTDRVRFVVKHARHLEVREVEIFGSPVLPTCSDGMQNQGEAGVDCGGPCQLSCGTAVGLDFRPVNQTCTVGESPRSGGIVAEEIWKDVDLRFVVDAIQAPDGDQAPFVLLLKEGILKLVPYDRNSSEDDTQIILDIRNKVRVTGGFELGMLGFIFDPNFASNRQVYVTYTTGNPNIVMRLSRFEAYQNSYVLNPASETVLLEVPQNTVFHQAGGLRFGPDGFLYMSLGDDTDRPAAADPQRLKGSVLRLDTKTTPPSVPASNPFGNFVYAYGLRNPWRFSFDRSTGELYVADVGESDWEEFSRVTKGGFYGWPYREADSCLSNCDEPYISPVYAYFRGNGNGGSITGGFVYRGSEIPSLYGKYVYADYISGKVFSYDFGTGENRELFDQPLGVASFSEDSDGELYFVNVATFSAYRISLEQSGGPSGPPENLLDTGCFTALGNPPQYTDGVVPYEVAQPFWSDGVDKERYFALPANTSLAVNDEGDFELPPGGVTIKNFLHEGKIFETRFFVRYLDGTYGGYTYKWTSDTSAVLVSEDGEKRNIGSRPWEYPSRGNCFDCHTQAANFSLGLESRQLNIDTYYPSTRRVANQIDTLVAVGLLDDSPWHNVAPFPSLSDPTTSSDEQVRAYLHVNCASCHRGIGTGRAQWDARYSTSLENKGLCDVDPVEQFTANPDEKLVSPGDAAHSTLWRRMNQRWKSFMPPIGSLLADPQGTILLDRWISELESCTQVQPAPYVVPTTIEAEGYQRAFETTAGTNSGGACNRGDGVDMELTTDVFGGTCNIGWTDAGEWLEYDISVPTAGLYSLVARVASIDPTTSLHIEVDRRDITGPVYGSGDGWQSFVDRYFPNIPLTEGNHTVRIVFDTGLINLNYFVLFEE